MTVLHEDDIERYEINVEDVATIVDLNIILKEDNLVIENINDILKKIYQECNFESGNYMDIDFTFRTLDPTDKFTNQYISYSMNVEQYEHKLWLSGSTFNLSEDTIITLEKMLNEDSFYKQFYISEYDMDENGKISFQHF